MFASVDSPVTPWWTTLEVAETAVVAGGSVFVSGTAVDAGGKMVASVDAPITPW